MYTKYNENIENRIKIEGLNIELTDLRNKELNWNTEILRLEEIINK